MEAKVKDTGEIVEVKFSTHPNPSFKDIATFSVRLADALIKELKGGKE